MSAVDGDETERGAPSTSSPLTVADSPSARGEGPPAAVARGALIGRYVVIDRLGAGGMGVVYSAYDPELNRKIALKLVVPRRGASAHEQTRLLREAQALARLSHPNVVAIHDVGSIGDRVFIAMELVEGQTLGDWLRESKRGWREVLDVFRAAGTGLAIAHEAGLVHRDFKPANILVGSDGRTRVMDFGLARATGDDGPTVSDASDDAASAPSRDALSTPLTRAGHIMGTPVYMPPESFRSATADAASDQFSFAVALYEALYGRMPFDTKLEPDDDRRWAVREPSRGAGVPRWLHDIVMRGLARGPAQRFPSMRDVVTALGRDPTARRRRGLWLAAAVAATSLVGLGALQLGDNDPPAPCRGAADGMVGTWDATRKQAARAALAADAWPQLESVLDTYATRWKAMRIETCEATRVRGDQSEQIMTLRMACLDRRRLDVAGIVALATTSAPTAAGRALKAAHELPPLDRCADVESLRTPVPPPEHPAIRGRADAIYADLARARAARDPELLAAVARAADELGWQPLAAQAHLDHAKTLLDVMSHERAHDEYERAVVAALAGNDDRTLAEAMMARIELWASRDQIDPIRIEMPRVEAIVSRLGDDLLRSRVMLGHALAAAGQSDAPRATELGRQALALRVAKFGADSLEVADAYERLAGAEMSLGRMEQAREHITRTLDIRRRKLGPKHPDLVAPLGLVAFMASSPELALAANEEAEAIARAAFGPDHVQMALALSNKAATLSTLGRSEDALAAHERANAIIHAKLGRESYLYPLGLLNAGEALMDLGHHARALASFEEALALFGDKEPMLTRYIRSGLPTLYIDAGRRPEALAALARVLEVPPGTTNDALKARVEAFGIAGAWHLDHGTARDALRYLLEAQAALAKLPPGQTVEWPLTSRLAAAYIAVGQAAKALPLAEGVFAAAEAGKAQIETGDMRIASRLVLARALVATGGDRVRAVTLAREALAEVMASKNRKLVRYKPKLERFLAEHAR